MHSLQNQQKKNTHELINCFKSMHLKNIITKLLFLKIEKINKILLPRLYVYYK